jgi:hypothetical protein
VEETGIPEESHRPFTSHYISYKTTLFSKYYSEVK